VFARDRTGIEQALSIHPWVPGSVARPGLALRVCEIPPPY
jgi:hypothetical protein